jgi:hypothetical protein
MPFGELVPVRLEEDIVDALILAVLLLSSTLLFSEEK